MALTEDDIKAAWHVIGAANAGEMTAVSECVHGKRGRQWAHLLLGDNDPQGVVASFTSIMDRRFYIDARTGWPAALREVERLRKWAHELVASDYEGANPGSHPFHAEIDGETIQDRQGYLPQQRDLPTVADTDEEARRFDLRQPDTLVFVARVLAELFDDTWNEGSYFAALEKAVERCQP